MHCQTNMRICQIDEQIVLIGPKFLQTALFLLEQRINYLHIFMKPLEKNIFWKKQLLNNFAHFLFMLL